MHLLSWYHLFCTGTSRTTVGNDLIKQHGRANSRGLDPARKAGTGSGEPHYKLPENTENDYVAV